MISLEFFWHGWSISCREKATIERLGRSKITQSLFPWQAELTELMVVKGESGEPKINSMFLIWWLDMVTWFHQGREWWFNKFVFSFESQNNESNFMQVIWDALGHSGMFYIVVELIHLTRRKKSEKYYVSIRSTCVCAGIVGLEIPVL